MKTSIILKEERSDIISQLENIKDVATTEERDLTSEENEQVDGLLQEVDNLDVKIERAEKMETIKRNAAVVSGITSNKEAKELKNYSFQDAMKQAVSGNLSGLVKEMDEEARRENPSQMFRGVAIPYSVLSASPEKRDVTTAGQNATRVMPFTDQLIASSVLASAGANFYTGVDNMKFPIVQNVASAFVAETGGTATAAGDTTSLSLSPNKIISIVDMSVEAMTQNSGLEAAIRSNMARSIAATLETNLLAASNAGTGPASIYDAATLATGNTLDAATLIAMESAVLGNNVPLEGARMAYICNSTSLPLIKAMAQVTSVSPIYDNRDKTINSYFSLFSSLLGGAASGNKDVLFGDFSRVHLAQFGGLDVLFDPYTQADHGMGRLVATSLVDGKATDNATAFQKLEAAS